MLLLSLLGLALAQVPPEGQARLDPPAALAAAWPAPDTLRPQVTELPSPIAGELPLRVALDPGHGVAGEDGTVANPGMDTADCSSEETFTLAIARDLARRLEATGRFEVILLREESRGAPYVDRMAQAEAQEARVLLSLHADSRGVSTPVTLPSGRTCPQRPLEPGFTVLFSMEGDEASDEARGSLARVLSAELRGRGFPPYDGAWYGDRYQQDEVAGVFIDGRGLAMLRRPTMPSVIIETHHAWHPEEWARWQEEETRAAFAHAVARSLIQWGRSHPPSP